MQVLIQVLIWFSVFFFSVGCPNDCSGHGQCISMREMANLERALPLIREAQSYGYDTDTTAWDAGRALNALLDLIQCRSYISIYRGILHIIIYDCECANNVIYAEEISNTLYCGKMFN
jgi:hypothetical protein